MSKLNVTSMSRADKKLIFVSLIGSSLEYFDFMTFVFIAPYIATLFFPDTHHIMGIIATYMTITLSYLFRPVGGIILGYLGNKYSRVTVFYISLLLMAMPSLCIGLLPTYSQIGYTATLLLIIMRILQGVSMGAEVPASVTYIAEKYSHRNYFFYCSWLTFGSNLGIVFASQTVHFLSKYTSSIFMYNYGWRIPFFASGILAFIGFYLRKIAVENHELIKIKTTLRNSTTSQPDLWYKMIPRILCGISICMIVSISTSVFLIFLPTIWANMNVKYVSIATNISSIGSLILAILSVTFAYLTKYINPARILNTSILMLLVILAIILLFINFKDIHQFNLEIILYVLTIAIAIATAGVNGLFFGLLADLFHTRSRLIGIAISYNLAYMLGAGLTPLWNSIYAPSFAILVIMLIIITFKPNPYFENYQ